MSNEGRKVDKLSPTWLLVERACRDIIEQGTQACIAPEVDDRKAQRLRGRIQAAREILKLAGTPE